MKSLAIKHLHLLCCTLFLSLGMVQAQATTQDQSTSSLAGIWQGAIEIPDMPLEVTVVLRQEAQAWRGTIDIPAQGAAGLALENIQVDRNTATFTIADVPGSPTFSGSLQGNEMTGTFAQSGQEFPFTLMRADEAQVPVGPAEQSEYQ